MKLSFQVILLKISLDQKKPNEDEVLYNQENPQGVFTLKIDMTKEENQDKNCNFD